MEQAILVPTNKEFGSPISLTNRHSIGRALNNTTVIEDVKVSRSHCLFEYKNGSWFLTDTSSNGTVVNGHLIKAETYKLSNHDIITLSANIKYEYQECSGVIQTKEIEQNHVSDDVLNVSQAVSIDPEIFMEDFDDTVLKKENLASANVSENQLKSDNKMESKLDIKNSNINYAEDELQCSICTEMFVKAVTLSCSHTFCKYCICQWRKNQTVCPICRAEIKMQFPTIVLDNFIDKIVENASEELKQHRKTLLAEREAAHGALPGPSTSNAIRVRRVALDPIEISSSESSHETDEADSDEYGSSDYDYSASDESIDYNGLPGEYYGGYGSCFRCGQKGHWANGCPVKRKR